MSSRIATNEQTTETKNSDEEKHHEEICELESNKLIADNADIANVTDSDGDARISKHPSCVRVTDVDGSMQVVFEKGSDNNLNLLSPTQVSVEDPPMVTNYAADSGEKKRDNSTFEELKGISMIKVTDKRRYDRPVKLRLDSSQPQQTINGSRKMLMFKKATQRLANDFKSRGSLHIDSRENSSRESSVNSRRTKIMHE